MIQAVLRYLVKNPDAKDTIEGIRRWWLPEELRSVDKNTIERSLGCLIRRGWLNARAMGSTTKFYFLIREKMEEIKTYLEDLEE